MENTIESNNKQIQKIVLGATASIGTLMGLSMGAAHADSVYTVKANDTLDKIAQANKISLTDLEKANKSISNPNLIFVNQKINIPNNSVESVNTQNVTVYTVQSGDTLSGIAQKFGADIQSIKADNNLASDTIYPGEQLKIRINGNDEHQQQTIHIPDVHPEASAQTTTNGTYTVQAGDSVYSVAKKHNMSVDELRDKNSMSKTDMLKPNSTIKVNNVSSASASSSESNKVQTSFSSNDLSSFSSVTQNAINEKSKSTSSSINSMSQSTVTVKQDNVAHAATTPSLQSSSVSKDVTVSSSSASQSSTPELKSSASSVKASEVNSSSQADYNNSAAEVNSQNSSEQTTTSTTDNQQANTQSSQANVDNQQTSQAQTQQPAQQTSQSADNNQASNDQATQTATSNQQQSQTQVAQANANNSQQTNNNSQDNKGEQIVNYAEKYVGTPYVWGGTTPAGFDCSGFTQYVYNHNGYNIGRTTYDQCKEGPHVAANQAQAGDLLFWGSDSEPYHVGISMGGDQYIAAPEPGENVKVGNTQYYQPSYAIHYNQIDQ